MRGPRVARRGAEGAGAEGVAKRPSEAAQREGAGVATAAQSVQPLVKR